MDLPLQTVDVWIVLFIKDLISTVMKFVVAVLCEWGAAAFDTL